jgi:hypothetical protein
MSRAGWLWPACSLGMASAGLEIAFRADPQLGMNGVQLAMWWGAASGLSVGLGLVVAGLAKRWRACPVGAVFAALCAVHAIMIWRFDHVVNRFARDPVVWGGALAILAVSAGLGWCIERRHGISRLVLRLGLLIAVLAPAVAVFQNTPAAKIHRASGPNVVVITLDTTRADRIGAYGSSNATPYIDALAREGVVFETVVTPAPLTEPAHLSLFTGQPPHVTGVVSNGTDIGDRPTLLYRSLQERGYATAGFVSAFPLHARFGWAQGMDVYDDDFGAMLGLHRLNLMKAWDQVVLREHVLRERRGDRTLVRALNWLDLQGGDPFFMWVHLFDPHGPYEAPGTAFEPPTEGPPLALPNYWPSAHRAISSEAWLVAAYDAEVRFADAQVGRLVAALRAQNVLDDTILVLTADHGESLTENGLLFDHGDDLFEPSLRIPLIVRFPGAAKPGHRVDCLASNMDVAPSIRALLGLPSDPQSQGVDRTAALSGAGCRDNPVIATTVVGRFVEPPPVAHALRRPHQKAIRNADGTGDCFGLGSAVADETRLLACPAGLLDALDESLVSGAPPVVPNVDADTTDALRALGYVE